MIPMTDLPLFDHAEQTDESLDERVYRVAEVNRMVRYTIEDRWSDLWVEGELSDVRHSGAGHVYFTLNDEDEQAQIRGVMFRSDVARTRAPLEDGSRVHFRGRLSLFEPRGQFQLIARVAKPAGEGDLAQRFEAIRRKLESEGLLDPDRKRTLPRLPRTVGVVTSLQAAALRDVIKVASKRCPVRLVVAPCQVQGDAAPPTIVSAIQSIQRLEDLDVVIVTRGGGSAEDLWAFNDELVARAIVACRVPVVVGVGHEIDFTIADLVADVRAATPSNAAELVVPDREGLQNEIEGLERNLARWFEVRIGRKRLELERLGRLLHDPRHALLGVRRKLSTLSTRLERHNPRARLARDRGALDALQTRLREAGRIPVERGRSRLDRQTARLEALSPLRVLERGYAIALREGKAIRSATEVSGGDAIEVRVADGAFPARVEDGQ